MAPGTPASDRVVHGAAMRVGRARRGVGGAVPSDGPGDVPADVLAVVPADALAEAAVAAAPLMRAV